MIRETCSCGGTIEVGFKETWLSGRFVLHDWRRAHNHEPAAPHEHNWISWGSVTEPATTETCGTCGATRAVEVDERAWDPIAGTHVHDWVPSPKDFYGSPRCRVCGMSDVTPRVGAADVLDIANDGSD